MYSTGQLCSEYKYYHTGVDSGDCSFVCLLVLVCVLSAEYSENTESFQLSFVGSVHARNDRSTSRHSENEERLSG